VCIDPRQTGFVGKGSDHLQLIKVWPSRAPGNGGCGGAKIFGSALLQPASLRALFSFRILLELRMMEMVVTTGSIGCAKLQSKCHHQQINIQLFTGHMPFLSPNQQCQSTEGKVDNVNYFNIKLESDGWMVVKFTRCFKLLQF